MKKDEYKQKISGLPEYIMREIVEPDSDCSLWSYYNGHLYWRDDEIFYRMTDTAKIIRYKKDQWGKYWPFAIADVDARSVEPVSQKVLFETVRII